MVHEGETIILQRTEIYIVSAMCGDGHVLRRTLRLNFKERKGG